MLIIITIQNQILKAVLENIDEDKDGCQSSHKSGNSQATSGRLNLPTPEKGPLGGTADGFDRSTSKWKEEPAAHAGQLAISKWGTSASCHATSSKHKHAEQQRNKHALRPVGQYRSRGSVPREVVNSAVFYEIPKEIRAGGGQRKIQSGLMVSHTAAGRSSSVQPAVPSQDSKQGTESKLAEDVRKVLSYNYASSSRNSDGISAK